MNRRKELIEAYKQMKPDMGIYVIRNTQNHKCWLDSTQDLKSKMNRVKFQLQAGSHPVRELQKEWSEMGEGSFTIEVLEQLKYDKDESKTDYSEELAILKMVWEEKLADGAIEFYSK